MDKATPAGISGNPAVGLPPVTERIAAQHPQVWAALQQLGSAVGEAGPLDKRTVRLVHLALYAFLVVMPMLGMATAWSDGKAVRIPFTGIALPALLPENESLAHTLEDLHGSIGQAFYWVIGAHIVAALWHHLFRRDDTLKRML